MTAYSYALVSMGEPEHKYLELQVERLVWAGCAMGNTRTEDASEDRNCVCQVIPARHVKVCGIVCHCDFQELEARRVLERKPECPPGRSEGPAVDLPVTSARAVSVLFQNRGRSRRTTTITFADFWPED